MLYRLLMALQDGDLHSLQGIARSLAIPAGLVQQMVLDLTRKGYLWESGSDCDTPRNACADCPVTSSCHLPTRYWSLTEKGRRTLASLSEKPV